MPDTTVTTVKFVKSLWRIEPAAKHYGKAPTTLRDAVERGDVESFATGCGNRLVTLAAVGAWQSGKERASATLLLRHDSEMPEQLLELARELGGHVTASIDAKIRALFRPR